MSLDPGRVSCGRDDVPNSRMIIEPTVSEDGRVRLEPVSTAHRDGMRALLNCDPEVWAIYAVSGYGECFPAFWDLMLRTPDRLSYAVWDKNTGRLAGTSSMFQIDPENRSLEIGYTWYHADFRGTHVNPAVKLLMMQHAFAAGALRVQFGVDTRNARSQAAMAKFAVKEGVIRRHKVTWTGHKRDTALFAVTDQDWPGVRERLRRRLEPAATAGSSAERAADRSRPAL